MSQSVNNSDWSRLAKDDGTIVLEHFEYEVVIGGDSATELTTTPTNINYSPTVNKVKSITLDVPPDSNLEGLTYLGEPVKLYVDKELAFDGEIVEINTQQKEGGDYSIKGEPQGKKLEGADLETTVDNEIVSDQISSIIDKYDTYDSEHEEKINTSDENLRDIEKVGGGVREEDGQNAKAEYYNIGSDYSKASSIYVKAFCPSSSTMTVNTATGSSPPGALLDSESISGLDRNSYGEWRRISNLSTSHTSNYHLYFELGSNCALMDWIVVTDETLKRDTTTPQVNTVNTGKSLYSWSGSQLQSNAKTSGSGINYDANGRPRTRQVSEWALSPFPRIGKTDFVDGYAGEIAYNTSQVEWDDFSPSDSLDNWKAFARVEPYELFINKTQDHTQGNSIYDDAWNGNASASSTQAAVNSTSVEITGDANKDFQWEYDRSSQFGDLVFSSQTYLNNTSTNATWAVEKSSSTSDGYAVEITSSTLYLYRLDTGTKTQLDSVSYTQQSGEWFSWDLTITSSGVDATLSDSQNSYSLTSSDTTHNIFQYFRVATVDNHYLDDMLASTGGSGGVKNSQINFDVGTDSATLDITLSPNFRSFGWQEIAAHDDSSSYSSSVSSTQSIYVEATAASETAFVISPIVFVHEGTNWSTSNFDLTVHADNGHLDYPPVYSDGNVFDNTVEFEERISQDNISESTVTSTVNASTNVSASWGPSQVIDSSSTSFPNPPNSTSDTQTYRYPGVQHITKYTLSGTGQRNTSSPREGYNRQRLDDLSVSVDTNDLEVLFDQDLSNNRLALINSLAQESTALFRWEGDLARVFHRGQKTTNPSLQSENISSSVSIEDVYRYCEVIGLHNVRSGVLESSSAPSYVDDKKVIRDDAIENETDAKNRARQFLKEHGDIKYKGNIRTAPTFAPLGAMVDGSLFNHGQDMVINGVRYGKRKTRINLGYTKNVATEITSLQSASSDTKGRETGKGMKVPVGSDQI